MRSCLRKVEIATFHSENRLFQICFGKYFEYEVFFTKTATDAANLFHKKHTSKKKTKISGVYLFGLHLKILNKAINVRKLILTKFNKKVSKLYNSNDIPILENLSYSVKKHIGTYEINYNDNDKVKKKQKTELIAKTFDEQNISRNSYRDLYAIGSHLPYEKYIYQEC
ncbi:17965_t:CDS:2 [Racocetra persica]|uniref:17965_t:CDS:1 n=1 Tax=Racocetra persica TaxID=160502 RepID=A0ACA9MUP1_9GLOM|nr:17965_t:CDS:2 [Racocetra persica]